MPRVSHGLHGSAVWCVKGRRLLKCAPEQLRPASGREELLEHLSHTISETAPWTFPRLVSELGGTEYEDLTGDLPTDELDTQTQTRPRGTGSPRRDLWREPALTNQRQGQASKERASSREARDHMDIMWINKSKPGGVTSRMRILP